MRTPGHARLCVFSQRVNTAAAASPKVARLARIAERRLEPLFHDLLYQSINSLGIVDTRKWHLGHWSFQELAEWLPAIRDFKDQ